jgi:protein involved in polysaccharide export with SLBB domain
MIQSQAISPPITATQKTKPTAMPALALVAKPEPRDAGLGVGDTVLVFVGEPPEEVVEDELTVLVAI